MSNAYEDFFLDVCVKAHLSSSEDVTIMERKQTRPGAVCTLRSLQAFYDPF